MNSAHFINKRDGKDLIGLTLIDKEKNLYSTEAWKIGGENAALLTGGWIFLHASKGEDSVIGGEVLDCELIEPEGEGRYRISFTAREEGRGKKWTGKDHGMAWWSGIVDAAE
jgi:hypothetical protein